MVIKDGYVLGVDASAVADVLVDDGVIVEVGAGLDTTGADVIDARDMVVAPGFVDAHRHIAVTPLRGVGADMTLGYYLSDVLGPLGTRYGVEDLGIGVLLGAVEALDAGVTTVFDWSNASQTPERTDAVVASLETSGIRAVFAHANPDNATDVRRHADRRGLVTTAVASHGPDALSMEDATRHIRLARELGLLTSMHVGGGLRGAQARTIHRMREAGLLGPDLLFSHGNMIGDDEIRMLADSGSRLVVSPVSESMMGHGDLAYGRFVAAGGRPALGVDVVVNSGPGMAEQMRATLWHERARSGADPAKVSPAAGDLLRAATINGAEAVGLGDLVGSIAVGKRADLVLLDGLAHLLDWHDGVEGAVVSTLGTAEVRTVLVDGRVVKRDGELVNHDLRALRSATRGIARRILGDQ